MKQPKWITDVVLVSSWSPGYWVTRGWDAKAIRRTTSVIDTVATDALVMRAGRTYVPVGGIADAGDRGISKVEVQVDEGPWQAAQLRAPLSGLTWVIWRYEWPFQSGEHVFKVRAYDGTGTLQTTASNPTFPSGATGIDTKQASTCHRCPNQLAPGARGPRGARCPRAVAAPADPVRRRILLQRATTSTYCRHAAARRALPRRRADNGVRCRRGG